MGFESFIFKKLEKKNRSDESSIYKRLAIRLQDIIKEVDNTIYTLLVYPVALPHYFLKEHFLSLTDCKEKVTPTKYFIDLVFNSIKNSVCLKTF